MAVTANTRTAGDELTRARQEADIDWRAIEASPEFQQLVRRKRRFVIPATIFFLSWYFGFIALAGYAEDFMGKSVYEGLTVGYVLALTQFVMVWVLTWMYLRKAERDFDPLERDIVERALSQPRVEQEVAS